MQATRSPAKLSLLNSHLTQVFNSGNIYQVVSYAKAFGCHGILVYPEYEQAIDASFILEEIAFRIVTIDISTKNSAQEMLKLADSLARDLVA